MEQFKIPGSVPAGGTVPLKRLLYSSPIAAEAALSAIGALPQESLRTILEVPGRGSVARVFGVLGNLLDDEEATDMVMLDTLAFRPEDLVQFERVSRQVGRRVSRRLSLADNDKTRQRLQAGKLKYTPVNATLVRRIQADIAPTGLHLPWSLRGLDLGFAAKCRQALRGFGFTVFYSEMATLADVEGVPTVQGKRLLSVAFGHEQTHTWAEPISDDIVDPDVGLLIEANARI